jgi:site-specific DNA-methyltransferase (adenine-specific)
MNDLWTRKEVIGDCTLYLGNCLEVMPALGNVDAVVTDIPYGISQKSNGLRRLDYGDWDGENATSVSLSALALLADVPSVIAWCDWRQLSAIANVLPDRSERPLTWAKPNPPVLNGQRLFLSATEHAFYGKKSGAWFSGGCIKSYWIGPPPIDRQHPTQKPEWLMKQCVQATVDRVGVAIDPFMGSGTTLVACAKLGRKGIGIELDPDYFEIACKRVQAAYDQPDLFVAPPTPPTQEGMDL